MKLTRENLKEIKLPLSVEMYKALRDSTIPARLWPKKLLVEYVRVQNELMRELVERSGSAFYSEM